MPTAYPYLRVSHDYSKKSGLSRDAQLERCRQYHAYKLAPKGVTFYNRELLYDGGISAFKLPLCRRPAGSRLMGLLQRGDHVLLARVDRAFRDLHDYTSTFKRWKSEGVIIHFLDSDADYSTPAGQLIANMLAVVAQWQSQQISERNKEIAAHLRRCGRPTNASKPYGYMFDKQTGQWVADQEEMALLAEITRLRDEEGLSFARISEEICRDMRNHNPRRTGGPSKYYRRTWHPEKVRRAYYRWTELLRGE